MLVEDFVSRLEGVRKGMGGSNRSWMAKCPSHEDRSASLKVTDAEGTILIKCFAGCGAAEVCQAVGINMAELFPPRNPQEAALYAREKFARVTLKEFEFEVTVAMQTLGDLARKQPLSQTDADRAYKARKAILKFMREFPKSYER